MNEEKLKSLKRQYLNTPIPEELESIVENILIEKNLLKMKRNKWQKKSVVNGSFHYYLFCCAHRWNQYEPGFGFYFVKSPSGR